ncbi:MAG: hypothetical protein CMJ78_09480 [Planctomycetaceae bacterium]|nr:hypothetical protein [Planctomycetaceae bacterium]
MFSLFPKTGNQHAASQRRGLTRRDAVKLGGVGMALPALQSALASSVATGVASAKRCLYIFLCGGPSQLDMWDPKPQAPAAIRGPFSPISTNVPGMQIGDLLPLTAQRTDRLAIVRSMMHNSTSHDTGIKYTLLGDSGAPGVAYPPRRTDYPGMGGILAKLLGDTGRLPAWVTVPRPFTTGSRFYRGQSGGFLGPSYDPFLLNEEKKDSLADKTFKIDSLSTPDTVNASRFSNRRELLKSIDDQGTRLIESVASDQLRDQYEKAFNLISSDQVRGAFDLELEEDSLRDRYGRNEYGQSFLLARRLAESGVRYVNVFWTYYGKDGCQFNLWDNHGSDKEVCGGYNRGVDMIRGKYCCPAFDKAFSALLDDLTARGMLDDTLVVVTGEFGRTPKINKNAGRDHWCSCYSTVLAGGGVRGGSVYGSSDAHAAYVKDLPVLPEDINATTLHAFGFRPEVEIHEPTGRPVRSSKGKPLTELFS